MRTQIDPAAVWTMVLHQDGTISGRCLTGGYGDRMAQLEEMAGGHLYFNLRKAWGAAVWTRHRASLTDTERYFNPFTPEGWSGVIAGPMAITGDKQLTQSLDVRLQAQAEVWAREIMAEVRAEGKTHLWEGQDPVRFPEFEVPGAMGVEL